MATEVHEFGMAPEDYMPREIVRLIGEKLPLWQEPTKEGAEQYYFALMSLSEVIGAMLALTALREDHAGLMSLVNDIMISIGKTQRCHVEFAKIRDEQEAAKAKGLAS